MNPFYSPRKAMNSSFASSLVALFLEFFPAWIFLVCRCLNSDLASNWSFHSLVCELFLSLSPSFLRFKNSISKKSQDLEIYFKRIFNENWIFVKVLFILFSRLIFRVKRLFRLCSLCNRKKKKKQIISIISI